MDEFRADLHCHSLCSDGTDTPEELLEKAHLAGLQGLSITDHDTLAAYTPALYEKSRQLKIALLEGAEVSSEWGPFSVHILAYGKKLLSASFLEFLSEMQERRKERNSAILEKLKELGMVIAPEELASIETRSPGRPHIAALLVEKGHVSSVQEAFDLYLKEGAPCYPFGCKYTPEEVIDAIHSSGGKAVLAHPHFLGKTPQTAACKNALLGLPFDGMECYYAAFSEASSAPWLSLAKEKGWIVTGGSDYHGTIKPHLSLGSSWTGKEAFDRLSSF